MNERMSRDEAPKPDWGRKAMYDKRIGMAERICAYEAVETRGIPLAELISTTHDKLSPTIIMTCC